MYSLQGIAIDTLVTLDHRMVICHRQKSGQFTPYYFTTAANVVGKPVRYLKTGWLVDAARSSWDNPWNIDKIAFAKLVGFFIGDGSAERRNSIRFNLRLPRKINFLCNLGIKINASESGKFSIVLDNLGQWFRDNCYDSDANKVLPDGYLTLSVPEVEALMEGLRNSDGTNVSNSWSYDSTSLKLIHQIQALAHINGLAANYSINNPNLDHPRHATGYRLHFSDRTQPRVEICQKNRSVSYQEGVVEYKGKVYCATVSTGALLVRRNMKVMVSGNCIEHPQIVFNCGYFPHSVMQQARTHRTGVSFDVQCLAANTEITFVDYKHQASPKLKKTIGELYELWTNGESAIRQRLIRGRNGELPGEYRRDSKTRIRKMRLRILNEETGLFEVGHIKDVMCSGMQPVYRVTLEDGKTIDCTAKHRLFTSEGWQTMGDAVGLLVNLDHSVSKITKPCYVMCNGVAVVDDKECHEHIHHNNLEAEFAQSFQPIIEATNWNEKPKPPGRKLKAHPIKVKSVEYLGEQMTYDLEVDGSWHNFVANGMVVHNSYRYTSQQVIDVIEAGKDIEEVFYLRPVGNYSDRQGKKYYYSPEQRQKDLEWCLEAAKRYKDDIDGGMSEEHARGKVPFDYRQHFVVSFNMRSLLHFLDLRYKKDAQLEIQKLCELMFPHLEEWTPAIATWYKTTRMGKARLSP
jgi:thymidylate synthase (FAD)